MELTAPTLFDLPAHRVEPIAPLLKWPGGKSGELDRIVPAMPAAFDRYFEPFVGGGAVFLAQSADIPALINDTSVDLMDFYRYVKSQDGRLFQMLSGIDEWWGALADFTESNGDALVDHFLSRRDCSKPDDAQARVIVESEASCLRDTVPIGWQASSDEFVRTALKIVPRKLARMRKVELKRSQQLPLDDVWRNVEGAFKASCYTLLRAQYNQGRLAGERSPRQAALFYFLREYSYAAMFRFNSRGEFNVPYGGITYNRKDFEGKLRHLQCDEVTRRLSSATLGCADFETFLDVHQPRATDFVFLDPPYDSAFSDYDLNGFTQDDHKRLARVMARLPCPFQMVVKSTPAVLDIYGQPDWNVVAFDKKYMWTIKERNDRDATHLMITNYAIYNP